MKITSYPITRDIRIGRIKSDPCEIVFVLNEDGAPMDLTGKVLELVFLTGNHAMLTLSPDDIDGNKAVFALTEEEKNKLYANLIYISVKLDGVTIGEGRFEWGSTHGEKSELPKGIGINVNNVTESIEWFEVIVGPRGAVGKSAWQYAVDNGYTGTEEDFALEMARLPEYADESEGYRDEAVAARDAAISARDGAFLARTGAETAAGNAAGSATAAGNSASDAAVSAGLAETAKNAAGGFAEDAEESATAAFGSAGSANTQAGIATTQAGLATVARTGAETARTGAEAARTGAEAARTGAETAQTGAQNARTGAEAARDEVNATKDSFIRNNTDVFGAKVTAIVSLTQAEFDGLALKLNTTMYIISPDPAAVILQLVGLTQAEYDGLAVKDDETAYLIEYAA